MKNKKWLTYTLGILLTLVVLAAVGGVGFRIGMTQNTSFARPPFTHNFDNGRQAMQGNFHDSGAPQAMQENSRDRGFDNRFNDRRDGGFSFFTPIFGLIRLVVLGLLLWFGYKFVKKSGWRLTREQASPIPAPSAAETPSAVVEEKKESE